MSAYVDGATKEWRGRLWCHLWADSESELHEIARQLGLRRRWFQPHGTLPHYDITANKRTAALRLGALQASVYGFYRALREKTRPKGRLVFEYEE